MKSLNVYLSFSGQCEEAMNFYKECLNGGDLSFMRFGESGQQTPDEHKGKIMHSELKTENVYIMASDGPPGFQTNIGNNVNLSLHFDNAKEQEEVFNKLADGGNVTMPLQDTFWDAKFGMLTDKYGVNWMLNFNKQK